MATKERSNTPSAIRSRARRERIRAEKLAAAATAKEQIEVVVQDARENGAEDITEIPAKRTRKPSTRPRIRAKGHKLAISYDREHRQSTGTCDCGWSVAGENRERVRDGYDEHLLAVTK